MMMIPTRCFDYVFLGLVDHVLFAPFFVSSLCLKIKGEKIFTNQSIIDRNHEHDCIVTRMDMQRCLHGQIVSSS